MKIKKTIPAATLLSLALATPALAGDPPPAPAAPRSSVNWTGFYLGGHLGMLTSTTSFTDPNGPPLYGGSVAAGGIVAGFQAGYNHQVAPQWVLGIEGEYSFLGAYGSNTCLQSSTTIVGSNCKVTPREVATLAGRAGFLTEPGGRTMIYGKAGVAWLRSDVSMNPNHAPLQQQSWIDDGVGLNDLANQADPTSTSFGAWGPMLGAGFEYAFSPRWSLKGEYSYLHFSGMSLGTPETTDVSETGIVTNLDSGGSSYVRQNLHIVKLGLNYRFGGPSAPEGGASAGWGNPASEVPAFEPGWEFDVGTRVWYSSGRYQNQNGAPNVLVSRLTYSDVAGLSGEVFGRVDAPFDVFVKGFIGVGGFTGGKMYDEDWGLSFAGVPNAYEVTQSELNGGLNYVTADVGYNLLRGLDHKVGLFVGYNRYETIMNATGCAQLVAPASGICSPPLGGSTTTISQMDVWQSLRLGVSAEAMLWNRLKVSADLAWLPYVKYDGLDIHRVRDLYFPVQGTGRGVQGELIVSWMMTDAFSVGVGGRYWSMWTDYAAQTTEQTNLFPVETDRYGVFLQASYRFRAAR